MATLPMTSAAAGLGASSFGAAQQPYAPLPAYGAAPSYGAPPSHGTPSYGTPSYAAPSYSSPIPLTPLITEEALTENGGGGGGGGGGVTSVTKIFGLPLKLLIPVCIILPIVAVVVVVAGGGGGGGGAGGGGLGAGSGGKKPKPCTKGGMDCKYPVEYTTPYYEYENNTTEYPDNPEYPDKQRRRRDAGASGLPAMSIAQVERLTQVVFSALRMQECQQRLLCELGTLSRSFSESAHSVAQAVEQFVPTSIKDSYDVFAKAENCEKYKCGSLEVKK